MGDKQFVPPTTVQPTAPPPDRTFNPARQPTPRSDVAVPLGQAAVNGILGALFICGLAFAAVRVGAVLDPWLVGILVFVVFVVLTWISWPARRDIVTKSLWAIEEFTKHDLTGDDIVGHPFDPKAPPVKDMNEIGKQRMLDIVDACLETHRTRWESIRPYLTWSKEPRAKADYYEPVRDRLIRRGIARWRNPSSPNLGWQFVDQNEAAIRASVKELDWIGGVA